MNEIRIEIPGVPVSKKRPRFFRRGNHVGTYNPQECEESKTMWHIAQAMTGRSPIEGPITLELWFEMPIPASMSKRERLALKGFCGHPKKPDLDNLIKHFMDAANGVLFQDDRQIWCLISAKKYSETPKTTARILKHEQSKQSPRP